MEPNINKEQNKKKIIDMIKSARKNRKKIKELVKVAPNPNDINGFKKWFKSMSILLSK